MMDVLILPMRKTKHRPKSTLGFCFLASVISHLPISTWTFCSVHTSCCKILLTPTDEDRNTHPRVRGRIIHTSSSLLFPYELESIVGSSQRADPYDCQVWTC